MVAHPEECCAFTEHAETSWFLHLDDETEASADGALAQTGFGLLILVAVALAMLGVGAIIAARREDLVKPLMLGGGAP